MVELLKEAYGEENYLILKNDFDSSGWVSRAKVLEVVNRLDTSNFDMKGMANAGKPMIRPKSIRLYKEGKRGFINEKDLRNDLAKTAMQALLSNHSIIDTLTDNTRLWLAQESYKIADVMIKQSKL